LSAAQVDHLLAAEHELLKANREFAKRVDRLNGSLSPIQKGN